MICLALLGWLSPSHANRSTVTPCPPSGRTSLVLSNGTIQWEDRTSYFSDQVSHRRPLKGVMPLDKSFPFDGLHLPTRSTTRLASSTPICRILRHFAREDQTSVYKL